MDHSGDPANFSISYFVYCRRPIRHSACYNQCQASSLLRPCFGRKQFQARLVCVFTGVAIPDPEAGFEVLSRRRGAGSHTKQSSPVSFELGARRPGQLVENRQSRKHSRSWEGHEDKWESILYYLASVPGSASLEPCRQRPPSSWGG